jgi:hypothetical protein
MPFAILLQSSTTPQPTPYAVYATLAVGVLSLIASSLNIYFSSKTAREIKEKDYQHDFYKKIISKIFEAWEEAKALIAEISETSIDFDDGKIFYSYCNSVSRFDELSNRLRVMIVGQTLWLGSSYGQCFFDLNNMVIDIRREVLFPSTGQPRNMLTDGLLRAVGKNYLSKGKDIVNNLSVELSGQLDSMHHVEEFFKEMKKARLRIVIE